MNLNYDNYDKDKSYSFDYIFNQSATQHSIYSEVSLLIQSLFNGNSICLLAYGQTCSGKTYTIQGVKENPGIIQRISAELIESSRIYNKVKILLSIVEVYNERLYNLLDNLTEVQIYEDKNNIYYIDKLCPVEVSSFEMINNLISISNKLRKTGSNNYNDHSSRSHCIYTFYLQTENNSLFHSRLDVVDLAGSERLSQSNMVNDTLKKEGISINKSLSSLSNVLIALNNSSSHVPYRDSKLTHYLKDSLSNKFNLIFYFHISPNIRDVKETISTLDFAERIIDYCNHETGKEKLH